jgi:hypothetical protein
MATLDQRRASARPDDDAEGRADRRRRRHGDGQRRAPHVVGYMKDFLFQPEQARTPVGGALGRRARPADAGARAGAAVEPAGAGRADQRSRPGDARPAAGMLADYPGTVLLVSHDRDFLDRVATSVIVAEGGGSGRNMPAAIPTCSPSAAQSRDAGTLARDRRGRAVSARQGATVPAPRTEAAALVRSRDAPRTGPVRAGRGRGRRRLGHGAGADRRPRRPVGQPVDPRSGRRRRDPRDPAQPVPARPRVTPRHRRRQRPRGGAGRLWAGPAGDPLAVPARRRPARSRRCCRRACRC